MREREREREKKVNGGIDNLKKKDKKKSTNGVVSGEYTGTNLIDN